MLAIATVTSQTFSLLAGGLDGTVEEEIVGISEEIAKENCINLIDEFERAGWITKRNLLGPTEWRYNLTHNKFL